MDVAVSGKEVVGGCSGPVVAVGGGCTAVAPGWRAGAEPGSAVV